MHYPTAGNRNRLLEVNKRLEGRVARKLRTHLPRESRDFAKYKDEVFHRSLDVVRPCSKDELNATLAGTGVLLIGDFHPDYFCKKYAKEVLAAAVKAGRKVVFATELVHDDEQPLLDKFLRGEIRERVLRKALREGKGGFWADRWYMWSLLLQFARGAEVPVYGINSLPGTNGNEYDHLRRRDLHAAGLIHDLKVANPGALVCALFGDLHLGPTHLPADIHRLFNGNAPHITTVLQNLGPVYSRLVESGLEQDTRVVRIDAETFCVIYCTPVFRSLSHLFDVITLSEKEEAGDEGGRDEVSPSNDDHTVNCATVFFGLILDAINGFLGTRIRKPPSDLLFAGFGLNGKKAFRDALGYHVRNSSLRNFLFDELELNHPCLAFGDELLVFVPTLNSRDIAEALGSYAHHSCLKNRESGLFLTDNKEFFYDEVLQRAIGYIFSKIISHHRECLTPAGCKELLSEEWDHSVESHERERASLFLQYSEEEAHILSTDAHSVIDLCNLANPQRFQLTRCVGYYLGERMFNAMIRDELSIEEFNAIIRYDPRRQSTTQLYSQLRERFCKSAEF